MKSNQLILATAAITAAFLCHSHNLNAALLPDGSALYMDAGGAPDASGQCTVGSCFGMEVSPGFWIWTMVNPGMDGGFIVGKNQLSGGQELASSSTNTTPGDMTAAWSFFSAFGTFFADNALNTFSDTSNDGATVLNDYNVAWNGNVIPMAGPLAQASMDDYTIVLDGAGGGSWSMDYTAVVSEGSFIGVPFWMIARGAVITEICDFCFVNVYDVSIVANSGEATSWTPVFEDPAYSEGHTCSIERSPLNGYATVNADCSVGSYTSGGDFEGMDSFDYTVTAPDGVSGTATVDVAVVILPIDYCDMFFPLVEVTTIGGGQRSAVNQTLQTTFTGHILTEAGLITGGRNTVKICPATTIDFTSSSTVGTATCVVNSAVAASTGTLAIGDKLICSNKPDGADVDRFSIKSGL